jgi:hypothetical protein
MMDKLPDGSIEAYARRKLEGESYTSIRKELAGSGLTGEEINETVRLIDKKVLQAEVYQGNISRSRQWYSIGLTLAIVGLLLTFGSSRGYILTGIPKIVVYSPFFAGILIMFYARMLRRRQQDPLDSRESRIKRKRPFKG